MTEIAPVVEVTGIQLSFGGQLVLDDISMRAYAGEMIALIGPNGSGKTSLCNVLSGAYRPDAGRIFVEGSEVSGLSQHGFGRLNISRTFQHAILVDDLSAAENIALGVKSLPGGLSLLGAAMLLPSARKAERLLGQKTMEMAKDLGLADSWNIAAGSLSNRQRRLTELARSLISEPKLVLIDELAAGLTKDDKAFLADSLQRIREEHLSESVILIIEHDVDFVRRLCPRTIVLDRGRVLAAGDTGEVLNNADVRAAYLGAV